MAFTKTTAFALLVAALCAGSATAQTANYTCTIQPGGDILSAATCTMSTTAKDGWRPGNVATISMSGQANADITAGTFKWQVYEDYVQHFIASGNSDYFHCDNKGCDRSNPISLWLDSPGTVPTNYHANFPFTIPAAQKNGHYHMVAWGEDQNHMYDINVEAEFHMSCAKDSDCPAGSYCMNYAGKTAPYSCH